MAIVKGVLVNDGGAPARILNFTAAAAISAGEALKIDTAGKLALATDNNAPIAGAALTDAASGDECSVITGSGIVLNMICKNDVNAGDALMVDSTAGQLVLCAEDGSGNLTNIAVALALEDAPAAGGLTKVLVM
jgi:phage-related tail fiber protein|tara:strand:- start:367 stop:768 length:402 start_codon:yes stop_codon:yes gene_type:complete